MKPDVIDELLRRAEPRILVFAGVGLLVLCVLAGVLYGIKPAWAEYADLKEKRERANASLLDGSGDGANAIGALEREVAALGDQLYGGTGGVPRSQIESFVVDSLDRISSRQGVELLGITPDLPTSIWMFEELPYSVQVRGSFFAIHRWLYEVEEELRPMVVKQFELSPSRDAQGVMLDLRVVAYRAAGGTGT